MARGRHHVKRKYDSTVLRAVILTGLGCFIAADIVIIEFLTGQSRAIQTPTSMSLVDTPESTTTTPDDPNVMDIPRPLLTITPVAVGDDLPKRTTSTPTPTSAPKKVITPAPIPAPKPKVVLVPITTLPYIPPVVAKAPAPPPQPQTGGGAGGNSSFQSKFYAAAATYGGIPYVYGGKSTAGADCSGFIWIVLKRFQPSITYRDSSSLKAWATPIAQSSAVPGDLVFWPGHVAVYAGNNKVISQGGPGPGPVVEDLWSGYTFGRIPL